MVLSFDTSLGASDDKNWFYVLDSTAVAGYIPKTYVFGERVANIQDFHKQMDELRCLERFQVHIFNTINDIIIFFLCQGQAADAGPP